MSDLLPFLKLHADMPGVPASDHPAPERLIAGNPRRDTWNAVDVAQAD